MNYEDILKEIGNQYLSYSREDLEKKNKEVPLKIVLILSLTLALFFVTLGFNIYYFLFKKSINFLFFLSNTLVLILLLYNSFKITILNMILLALDREQYGIIEFLNEIKKEIKDLKKQSD